MDRTKKLIEGRKCILNMELEKNVKNKMDRENNEGWSLSRGEIRKITFKNKKKNRRHSLIGQKIWHNELVVNIPEGGISAEKAVGRPRLQYLMQITRDREANIFRAMKKIACNSSRRKAANQSKDWRIKRRRKNILNMSWANSKSTDFVRVYLSYSVSILLSIAQ